MLSSYTWDDLNISLQDLTPLNQPLIPNVLAQAFAIPVADAQKTENAAGSSYATLSRSGPSFGMQNNSYTQSTVPNNMLPPGKPTQNMTNKQQQNNYPYSQALPQYGMPMQNIQAAMSAGNHPSVGPSPSVYAGFPYGAVGPQTMLPYNMQDPSMYGFPPFGGFPAPAGMFPPFPDYRQPVMVNKESDGKPSGEGDFSEETQARALKRPRLVWTPQLHKCFVEAVNQIGVDKAVPKMIMQIMNVEGLTRENVASHLQKYRLQLKRQEDQKPPDGKEGQGQSCKGSLKKKRRKFSSGYDESRGGGSPIPHITEGLGSTDKSPEVQQHYCNAAAPSCSDHSGEVDEGCNEDGRLGDLPVDQGNTDNDVCSQHGAGNEPES